MWGGYGCGTCGMEQKVCRWIFRLKAVDLPPKGGSHKTHLPVSARQTIERTDRGL